MARELRLSHFISQQDDCQQPMTYYSRLYCNCFLQAYPPLMIILQYLLWDQFKAGLYDNVKHKLYHMNHYQADQKIPEDDIYDYSLWDLNRILVGIERSFADFPPMSLLQQQQAHRIPNPLLQAKQYDVDEMVTLVDEQRAIFNPDQAAAFDAVLESITNNQGHLFFIHAAGDCGKTFCITLLLLRLEERIRQHYV